MCRSGGQHSPARDARKKYKKFIRRQRQHLLAIKGKAGVRRIWLGATKGVQHR